MAEGPASGTVVWWSSGEGWGVLRSEDVPGNVFCHFFAVQMLGYRDLVAGEPVTFTWEVAEQDGYHFRAVKVFRGHDLDGTEDWAEESTPTDNPAYRSSLTIDFDGDPPRSAGP